jgi:hypothetical protein
MIFDDVNYDQYNSYVLVKKNHMDGIESDTSEEKPKPKLASKVASSSKVMESFVDDEATSVVLSM